MAYARRTGIPGRRQAVHTGGMRMIGLVGGMSWYSTMDYYRTINAAVQERLGGHASAPLTLQSLDFAQVRAMQLAGEWEAAGALLADAARRCQDAGAETVLICTNLMHRVADVVEAAIDVPLLRVTDAVADAALARGVERLGLLGTRWTMEEDFYVGRLRARGLEVLVPDAAARVELDRIVFDELTRGVVDAGSAAACRRMVERLEAAGAGAVVLGCTEIQLLLGPDDARTPVLDSMAVHAAAAARFCLDGAALPA